MVRSMPNAAPPFPGSLISSHATVLPDDAGGRVWIQLLPAGTVSGRDGRGPFVFGDRAGLAAIAEATRRWAGPVDLVIDYEHQSLNAAENGRPAPAAGWVGEFEARDDGLYGRVRWTEAARAMIAAHEYRYLSPVFFHSDAGEVLALQSAALTNTPNMGLAEVSAHALCGAPSAQPKDRSMSKEIAQALGLADNADDAAQLAAIAALKETVTAVSTAAGAPDGAGREQILAAMRARTADPAAFVPIAQVQAMQAELGRLKAQVSEDKAVSAVDDAIRTGKIAPAVRDWALSLHRSNPTAFAAFVAAAPVLPPGTQSGATASPATPPSGDGLSAHHRAIAAAMGVDPKAYARTLAAEAADREEA